jgi:hypothetical protein
MKTIVKTIVAVMAVAALGLGGCLVLTGILSGTPEAQVESCSQVTYDSLQQTLCNGVVCDPATVSCDPQGISGCTCAMGQQVTPTYQPYQPAPYQPYSHDYPPPPQPRPYQPQPYRPDHPDRPPPPERHDQPDHPDHHNQPNRRAVHATPTPSPSPSAITIQR